LRSPPAPTSDANRRGKHFRKKKKGESRYGYVMWFRLEPAQGGGEKKKKKKKRERACPFLLSSPSRTPSLG